jgi:hypothetical protein
MKDFFNKYWHVVFGGGTAVSFKGISDIAESTKDIVVHTPIMTVEEIIKYILIAAIGTITGLLIRIMWGVIKRRFPSLKGIDK